MFFISTRVPKTPSTLDSEILASARNEPSSIFPSQIPKNMDKA